jgi:hypothetical protein
MNTLTKDDLMSIVDKRYQAIPELVKRIHIDIPENRNIYIPSEKGKYIKVFNGQIWQYVDQKQMLETLVVDNSNRMFDFINNDTSNIEKKLYKKVDKLIDELDNENKSRENCKERLKSLLLSYNKTIKDSIKNSSISVV